MTKIRFIQEAYNEAIEYTLQLSELSHDDAIDFLTYWNEGCWDEIKEHFPDFNLESEAQAWLVKGTRG